MNQSWDNARPGGGRPVPPQRPGQGSAPVPQRPRGPMTAPPPFSAEAEELARRAPQGAGNHPAGGAPRAASPMTPPQSAASRPFPDQPLPDRPLSGESYPAAPPQRQPGQAAGSRAEAAQEAALRAMRAGQPAPMPGRSPYADARRREEERYASPAQEDFVEDFFAENDEDEVSPYRKHLLMIVIPLIIGLLVLAFIFFLSSVLKRQSNARLERQTRQTSKISETERRTSKHTTAPRKTKATETLPPLQTDPYENLPAWTPAPETLPPTESPSVTYPPFAPPPIVNTLPSEEPAQPLLPMNPPAAGDAQPQPQTPEQPSAEPQPQTPAEEQPAGGVEAQVFDLPNQTPGSAPETLAAPVRRIPPRLDSDKIVAQVLDANGVPTYLTIPGSFDKVYASPDGLHLIAHGAEGYTLIDTQTQQAIPLGAGAPLGMEGLVSNQGYSYLMNDGMLYYSSFDGQPSVMAAGVSSVLMASESDQWMALKNDGSVVLFDTRGEVAGGVPLLQAGVAQGQVTLKYIDPTGKLAVFQDEGNVYFYHNSVGENTTSSIPVAGDKLKIETSPDGSESLLFAPDTAYVIRIKGDGSVDQILMDQPLTDEASILPAGSDQNSAFAQVAILDRGALWLSNDSLAGSEGARSALLENDIKEAVTAPNAVYWIDASGVVKGLDARADLSQAVQPLTLSGAGSSQLLSSQDGSVIYYLQGNNLYSRRSGQAAQLLAQNAATYFINADGSRCYILTAGGGLLSVVNGQLSELASDGSGLSKDSFLVNSLMERGGNSWIGSGPFQWNQNGTIMVEG